MTHTIASLLDLDFSSIEHRVLSTGYLSEVPPNLGGTDTGRHPRLHQFPLYQFPPHRLVSKNAQPSDAFAELLNPLT